MTEEDVNVWRTPGEHQYLPDVRLRSLLASRGLMWCLLHRWIWRSAGPPTQPTCSPHSLHTTELRSRGRPVGSGSNPKKYHGLLCEAAGLLSSFSVPGIKSYFSVPWELGDGKEIMGVEMKEGQDPDVPHKSPAVSGCDIVATSLMTGMGLCDWLWSDQRDVLLGSGRVTSWMSCRRRSTVSFSPTSHFTLSPDFLMIKTRGRVQHFIFSVSTLTITSVSELTIPQAH